MNSYSPPLRRFILGPEVWLPAAWPALSAHSGTVGRPPLRSEDLQGLEGDPDLLIGPFNAYAAPLLLALNQ